ncbi:MAG: transposase [Methanoregulaceae archaeon]
MIPILPSRKPDDWIGVDLNTIGYLAVLAHPSSGKVIRLGKNVHRIHEKYEKLRKNFETHKKFKKLRKIEGREQAILNDLVKKVSRQIVSHASALRCGIKLEQIHGRHAGTKRSGKNSPGFPVTGSSFYQLQKMVESHARDAGVIVAYVDPAFTSQRCYQCGQLGYRKRKKFECPHCGFAEHADVNAAFNIADSPILQEPGEGDSPNRREQSRFYREQSRFYRELFRKVRGREIPAISGLWDCFPATPVGNIFLLLE